MEEAQTSKRPAAEATEAAESSKRPKTVAAVPFTEDEVDSALTLLLSELMEEAAHGKESSKRPAAEATEAAESSKRPKTVAAAPFTEDEVDSSLT